MTENETNIAEEIRMDMKRGIYRSTHPRYDWLDQFRGMVIVFLVIASLTWEFSSENFMEAPPLGPTWLNHGWRYANQQPAMITIVDMGSQIFMFMLGISLSLSFKSKVNKKGTGYSWMTVIHRVLSFFWIAQVIQFDLTFSYEVAPDVYELLLFKVIAMGIWVLITIGFAVLRNLKKFKNSNLRPLFGIIWAVLSSLLWYIQARGPAFLPLNVDYFKNVYFTEPIAHLAWGTLISAVFVFLVKKPDYRVFTAIIVYIGHAIMWEFESEINTAIRVFWLKWEIPFDVLAMGAIAIIASCVWDWLQVNPNDQKIGMKKRVFPLMLITGVLHFIVDFFQTAEHHGINVSLGLLAIAFSSLLVMIFFSLENYYNYKIPPLTHLGRNALFLFLLQGIFTLTYPEIWGGALEFRTQMATVFGLTDLAHPLVDLMAVVVFLAPMLIIYIIAWLFDRYHIYIKV